MTAVYVIYRISDGSHKKDKLVNATKAQCLANARAIFPAARFHVLADNCREQTLQWLREMGLAVEPTAIGNSGSFRRAIQLAAEQPAETIVYLLEDDYLHLPGSAEAMVDGLGIADYVSLYDHPDKYDIFPEIRPNPRVRDGGEPTRVLLTKSRHWKLTGSTTMTFAATARVLREDLSVWLRYTRTSVPQDYKAFRHLLSQRRWRSAFTQRNRRLVTPLPTLCTHAESRFWSPLVDWSKI